jgi:hypothetical protein
MECIGVSLLLWDKTSKNNGPSSIIRHHLESRESCSLLNVSGLLLNVVSRLPPRLMSVKPLLASPLPPTPRLSPGASTALPAPVRTSQPPKPLQAGPPPESVAGQPLPHYSMRSPACTHRIALSGEDKNGRTSTNSSSSSIAWQLLQSKHPPKGPQHAYVCELQVITERPNAHLPQQLHHHVSLSGRIPPRPEVAGSSSCGLVQGPLRPPLIAKQGTSERESSFAGPAPQARPDSCLAPVRVEPGISPTLATKQTSAVRLTPPLPRRPVTWDHLP